MGLRRTKSSPLHAWVCPQSTHPLPTPSPSKATGSTLYPHAKPNYGAKKQYSQEDDDSPALSKAGKIHPRGVWSIHVPRKGGRWGTTPCPQLTRVPTYEPDGKKQWSYASSFWTSCHARKKPYSPIEQATWSSQSTATRHTCPNPNPKAAQEATCSWREKTKSPSTTGQSSTFPK